MRAFAVTPGTSGSGAQVHVPAPEPGPEECLIAVLETGICGTDREIARGEYGVPPPGRDRLVIGHEALGVVVQSASHAAALRPGDLVVPTVRRACTVPCLPCRSGQPDFCTSGRYRERGIRGLDGFLTESFLERPEHLVEIPAALRSVGVLLEPLTTVEKAFRQVERIQQRVPWHAARAIVTGAGPIGVLAALVARLRGLDVLVYSRDPEAGPRGSLFARAGVAVVDAESMSLRDAAAQFGAADVLLEATGHSPLAWEGIGVLDVSGVACLLSVTGGDQRAEIASDALNLAMVLGNRVAFGSVSAHRLDFEQGVRDLAAAQTRWPGLLDSFITERVPLEDVARVLASGAPEELKVVVQVGGDAAGA